MRTERRAAESEFRERALAEAQRYGSDSWVFVRELLQNARDAGARRVDWSTEARAEVEILRCRDDGGGMSLEHARRYLFALYASSKEDDARQAGQFGVGFWSVLRFRPRRVMIRSRPAGSAADSPDAWQATLDGDLSGSRLSLASVPVDFAVGTEVVLERPRRSRALGERLAAALQRYGRFLTVRDDLREPLPVFLDGRRINVPFALPAPSASFRRRGWRGVVALGESPRVELFANGLFVREATCLEELLDDAEPPGAGGSSLTLPGSVAPQIYLDSNQLEPLLARSDVRQDRHLRRLLRRADKELERLIERQLAALRGGSWLSFFGIHGGLALWDRIRERWMGGASRGSRLGMTLLVVLAVVLGTLAAPGLWRLLPSWPWAGGTADERSATTGRGPASGIVDLVDGAWGGWPGLGAEFLGGDGTSVAPAPYADLGEHYLGPRLDPLGAGDSAPLALLYHPPEPELYFAALVIEEPRRPPPPPRPAGPYEGPDCAAANDCVAVHLEISPSAAWIRLPVPTGYRVDPRSVRLGARILAVSSSASGEALLEPRALGGSLRYEVSSVAVPATVPPTPFTALPVVGESLPEPFDEVAVRLREAPPEERVQRALDEVARRVAYDRSLESALQYRSLRREGAGLLSAALAVGGGDCDIQNGVLVEVLRRAGVEARLAVGWVGRGGGVISALHAWAEVLEDGRYRVADVSARFASVPSASVAAARVRVPSAAGAGSRRDIWRGWPFLALALLLPAVAWFLVRVSRGVSRDLRLSYGGDLAGLVAGALEHPGLARMPVLRYGRLLPLVDGGALSLAGARRRAEAGRLFASARRGELTRRALRRHRVLDAATPEGKVASLGLGAIDLDEWQSLLGRRRETPFLDRLNSYLAAIGAAGLPIGRVTRVDKLGRPWMMVDLDFLYGGERCLLVDGELESALAAEARSRPARALFRLLDRLAAELDLEPEDRARLLAPAARRMLLEETAEGAAP